MSNFCLTPDEIKRISTAMKEVGGQVLVNKSFADLVTFFAGVIDSEINAVEMAKGFKLSVISRQKNSLQNWLKKTLNPNEIKNFNQKNKDVEKTKVLKEYRDRKRQIRADLKDKKITARQARDQEIIAKSRRNSLLKTNKDDRIKANIKRLQTRLEDIKKGKVQTREKRELSEEEKQLHLAIDTELKKLAEDVSHIDKNIDRKTIEKALGLGITTEEVETILNLSKKIDETKKLPLDNPFGIPNLAYFKAKQEMQLYLQSRAPTPNLGVITGVIARGNLLFSIKSPVTNIISNISMLFSELVARRIASRKFKGVNSDLVKPFVTHAFKVYQETGYDIVRMLRLQDERLVLGEKQIGVEGSGKIRRVGKFYEDWIYKGSMGAPDILFAALHFADSLNINSSKLADSEGLTGEKHKARSRQLMLKGMSLELDESEIEAIALRDQGVADALFSTYQNDTFLSQKLLETRGLVDDITGNLKLGTFFEPFVKTVANVSMAGFQYTGLTLPLVALRTKEAIEKAKDGEHRELKNLTQEAVRAGVGLTVAFLIASLLADDDEDDVFYIPEYSLADTDQRRLARLNNSGYNAIRINNKWVSLDYFGALGAPIAAFASMKSRRNTDSAVVEGIQGIVSQLGRMPVLGKFFDINQWYQETKQYQTTDKDMLNSFLTSTASNIYSRSVPMIISDFSEMTDDVKRVNDYEVWYDDVLTKIPFLRATLPKKYSELGEVIPTEGALWTLLFGARIKTQNQNLVVNEITRLQNSGTNIKLETKDLTMMKTAKSMMSFDEYNEFHAMVQHNIMLAMEKYMSSSDYKKTTDEKREKQIEDAREKIMIATAREMGYYSRIKEQQKEDKKAKEKSK